MVWKKYKYLPENKGSLQGIRINSKVKDAYIMHIFVCIQISTDYQEKITHGRGKSSLQWYSDSCDSRHCQEQLSYSPPPPPKSEYSLLACDENHYKSHLTQKDIPWVLFRCEDIIQKNVDRLDWMSLGLNWAKHIHLHLKLVDFDGIVQMQ